MNKRSWAVRSTRQLGAIYSVTQDVFGDFSCTCPDFQFRGGTCKHIKKVKRLIAGEEQKNKLPGSVV